MGDIYALRAVSPSSNPWTCTVCECINKQEDHQCVLCEQKRAVIYVKCLNGATTWLFYNPLDTILIVKTKCIEGGADGAHLVFKGSRLSNDSTLAALLIEPWATLHQVPHLRGDIGLFVGRSDGEAATLAPGATLLQLLRPAPAASPPPAAAVAALAAAVLAPSARAPRGAIFEGAAEVAPPAARAALTAAVEAAWARGGGGAPGAGLDAALAALAGSPAAAEAASVARGSTRRDFRMLLAAPTVVAALGAGGVAAILGALEAVRGAPAGAAPLALARVVFVLRRTEARAEDPQWINFHYDAAALTAQVPLSGGGDTVGGRTVYALPSGELLVPPRAAGAVLAHHGDVAHGVTQLERGVRYGLYALVARGDC